MKFIAFETYLAKLSILSFLSILLACESKLDRTDMDLFSKSVFQAVAEDDTAMIRDLFWGKMRLSPIYKNTGFLIGFTKKQFKDKELVFLKYDTLLYEYAGIRERYVKVYGRVDTTYYEISGVYGRDSLNQIELVALAVVNLNEKCQHYNTTPYWSLHDAKFMSFKYKFDPLRSRFTEGKVEVRNEGGFDINYLRFRLNVAVDKKPIFNQNVEYKSKFYQGDVVNIDVESLRGFDPFVQIGKDLTWDALVIEILPKPESQDCKKLEELKKF